MSRQVASTRTSASTRATASAHTVVSSISRPIENTNWMQSQYLKAYYPFNNGRLLTDFSPNNHTLTPIGVPIDGTPKFNGSVGLGTSQAFSAVDGADFQPAGNFSVAVWVRTTKTGLAVFIFQSYSQNTNVAGITLKFEANNRVYLTTGKNTGTTANTDFKQQFTTSTTLNDGAWHHVVGTYDGTKIHIFVDGAEDGTGTAWTNAAAFAATNYVRVGCGNVSGTNTGFFQGSLSEVLFFNGTALSLAQVQSLYANSINHASNAAIKADANLKAIYLFADGAQLTDSTANAHTLTAIGTPTTLTNKFGGSIFLGNSSAYSAVDHADFQPTGAFSIGVWFKTNSTAVYIFQSYSESDAGAYAGLVLYVSGNKLSFYFGDNTGTAASDYKAITGGTTITNGNWHFGVVTWDLTNLRMYIDGVSDATAIATGAVVPAYSATNYVRVGCVNKTGANATFFPGQLDDIFLLHYAMTAGDVKQVYSSGRNPVV